MKVLGVIVARGGSKGIPGKNLKEINGKPLIQYSIEAAQNSKNLTDFIVSTDGEDILEFAKSIGANAPFVRSNDLSDDVISPMYAVLHAKKFMESQGKEYDAIMMLQPTAPFRNVKVLKSCLTKLIEENLDSVWTISEVNNKYNPLKQLKISEEKIKLFDNRGTKIIARQQLEKTYIRNGQCYCFTRKSILEYKTIFPEKNGYLITPSYPNIDTTEDFKLAEYQFNNFINE